MSRLETLFYVLLPNIKPSLLTGIVISFAHTVGELCIVTGKQIGRAHV